MDVLRVQRRFSADDEWIQVSEARFPIHCHLQNPEKEKKGFAKSFSTAAVSFGWKGCGRRGGEISFDKSSFYFIFYF